MKPAGWISRSSPFPKTFSIRPRTHTHLQTALTRLSVFRLQEIFSSAGQTPGSTIAGTTGSIANNHGTQGPSNTATVIPIMASDNALPDTIDGKPRPSNVSAFFVESTDTVDYDNRWGRLWRARWTPWDRGGPSMPLYDVLVDRRDLFPSPLAGKKALVPGAGRGHDVLLLASFGFDAYGLDLSSEASAAAKENEEKNGGLRIYKPKEGQRGSVVWLTGDFFSWDFSGIGKFDLIFDYTVCTADTSTHSLFYLLALKVLISYTKSFCVLLPRN